MKLYPYGVDWRISRLQSGHRDMADGTRYGMVHGLPETSYEPRYRSWRGAEAQAKDALRTFASPREEIPMRQILFKSPSDDGFDRAIANWENEGGAMRIAPDRLSLQVQRDLLEREIFQAILIRDLDDEGAFRPFHSFPWAIRTTVVE